MSRARIKNTASASIPTPASGHVMLFADTDKKIKQKDDTGTVTDLTQGASGSPTATTVVATGDTTTTSETFVLMNSMTITPGAGNYLVLFGAQIEMGNPDDKPQIAIFANGSLVDGSPRTGTEKKNSFTGIETHAVISGLGVGQAIEGRWLAGDGNTITASHRRLTIVEIS